MNGSVYEKIIAKGQEEAENIINQGLNKANSITEQTLKETDSKIQKLLCDNENKCADLLSTKSAELAQISKQRVLSNQKDLIKDVFNEALKKLQVISDDDLIKLVNKYIKEYKLSTDEVIMVNKNDHSRYQRLFSSKKNNVLDKLGNIILSDECLDITGGFVISGKYFDICNSYEELLVNLAESLETEVALKLFNSGE